MIDGKKVILSMGGGMESSATLGLTLFDPRFQALKPDLVIFANLGSEWKETYAHLKFLEDICKKRGIEYVELIPEVFRGKKLFGENRKYTKLIDYLMDVKAVPGKAPNGKRLCTELFKVKAIQDYLKERFPGEDLIVLIGFGSDEKNRIQRGENTVPGWTNRFLLDEADMCRCRSIEYHRKIGWPVPRRSGCTFCFSGETEVLTDQGTRPIRELVGRKKLLIPIRHSMFGKWTEVEVRSFGIQNLMKLTVNRGKIRRAIYVTPEHQWVLRGRGGARNKFIATVNLQNGDHLPTCWTALLKGGPNPVRISPFGVAHGFVFGDGHVQYARPKMPAMVVIYGKKDRALLPFFGMSYRKKFLINGAPALRISDLPRSWKSCPPLTESRSYLLGWLSGYFAADGHVTKNGQAVIYSAKKTDIAYVKDLCLLIGVRVSSGGEKSRIGFKVYTKKRKLYFVSINIRDVPEEFWILPHHRKRIIAAREKKVHYHQDWIVESVKNTSRMEEVFCAVVPGKNMFVLADGLITGNCPFAKKMDFQVQAEVYPEEWELTVALERNNRRFNDPEKPFFMVAANKPVDEWIQTKDQKRVRICKGCGQEVDLALHVFGDTPLYAMYKALKARKEAVS